MYVRLIELKRDMIKNGVIESYTCKLQNNDLKLFISITKRDTEDLPNYFAMLILMSDDDLIRALNRVY